MNELHQTVGEWDSFYNFRIVQDPTKSKLTLTDKIVGITYKTIQDVKTARVLTIPVYIVATQRDSVIEDLDRKWDACEFKRSEAENMADMQINLKNKAQEELKSYQKQYGEMKLQNVRYQHEVGYAQDYAKAIENKLLDIKDHIGTDQFSKIVGDIPKQKVYRPGSMNPKMSEVPVE